MDHSASVVVEPGVLVALSAIQMRNSMSGEELFGGVQASLVVEGEHT